MPENIKQHAKNDSSNHFSCLGGKKWTCITFSKKKKILVRIMGPGHMAFPGK